ncbi:YggS family pyridoxal phosphate-dependent enzyme [Luteimonas sp. MC1750]|uniref:YggS family pyridoxal phosphate-dependent enzyme n=1 Tax=Luteimonas sp. MC1750 TaxID=2799326 RepID=UPI0018F095C6|nr:YggS family pyridoxal phosphate-dependent enzyme [Luteimonas sp. MC1750]MBJ6983562.1 YggS family pyridoxal phosphate-dependent enzyme [Luteimonas sp. MC1750]QQO06407.1 YggS family pyridoxal phosphate-dependent enzyme [Luteimonas sp. MC1750]
MPTGPLARVLDSMENAAAAASRPAPRLVAVGKTRSAGEIAALAADWSALRPDATLAFGENYVQEAAAKIAALDGRGIEWHLIGHLQSNKAAQAAAMFDWVQSVDRPKLVAALAAARDAGRPPLNVLIQVNVDGEAGKHGCAPGDVPALAADIAAQPGLALRGLMAIPEPHPDLERRRAAFAAMHALHAALRRQHPGADTLSMGMSEDHALAIAEGATMVRIGTALFGARPGA